MKLYLITLLAIVIFSSCNEHEMTLSAQKEITIAMRHILPENSNKKMEIATGEALVFIAGFDEGDSNYYEQAAAYFKNKNLKVIEGLYSLEEIITWLHGYENNVKEIHVVNHSNAWRGMALKTTKEGPRVTQETLAIALETNQLDKTPRTISNKTKIVFHSCGLGTNTALLKALQKAFSNMEAPQVLASPYFNVFGGKYADHYLATPYYIFYPTAHSPGPLALSREMAQKYSGKNIDWFTALTTRKETTLGTPFSYRFNVPVNWVFEFESAKDIPEINQEEQLIHFILEDKAIMHAIEATGIPITKFRWRTSISGKTLTINGKSTVLSVLDPIMNTRDKNAYIFPEITNTSLYTTL